MKKLYLTKSRFKNGSNCATKLYYYEKPEYGNSRSNDSFLQGLAAGGFQVGELAKIYHPGGIEVLEKDNEAAVARTSELLKQSNVTIFEATIRHNDFLVKIDVLKKTGDQIELIEVKAKSYDAASDENDFFTKRGKKRSLRSEWQTYLEDVAFQTFVLGKAYPQFKITPYLMLADKSKTASVEGLNQMFFIERAPNGRSKVKVRIGTDLETVGREILCKIDVHDPVKFILHEASYTEGSFEALVMSLSNVLVASKKCPPTITSECKKCEFRIDLNKFPEGTKSGFFECFSEAIGMTPKDTSRPLVFDIWNFRGAPTLMQSGTFYMDQVEDDDISVKESATSGMSASERQLLQVKKVRDNDPSPFVNLEGLTAEMKSWKFPLHFIDFETTTVALPFTKGRRPYEQNAFQFSHHIVHESGKVEHATQYIHRVRGEFPNFAFVRELRKALQNDQGTIFRYSHHENTVLCQIATQLEASKEPDVHELIEWIHTVTSSKGDGEEKIGWEGHRTMVDLCEVVKRFHYSPATNGSNSIKKVLPAILRESSYLKERYSKPIYGAKDGIASLNYNSWTWLSSDTNNTVSDPYKLLPPIFSDEDLEAIEPLVNANEIADGGAAMMAYALTQFTEMTQAEADKIFDALLKYCELDTLAMVMIYEHWTRLIKQKKTSSVA